MNRTAFTQGIASLLSSKNPMGEAEPLMRSLLSTRSRWTQDAILDMVHGVHGEEVATFACRCVTRGIAPTSTSKRGETFVYATESFLQWCIQLNRPEVLRALALRDAPEQLKFMFTSGGEATTPAGHMLDAMTGVKGNEHASCPALLRLLEPFEDLPREGLVGAVTLIAELDPDHQGVPQHLAMTALGAEFTAARMRLHIDQVVTATPTPIANTAPARARHAL